MVELRRFEGNIPVKDLASARRFYEEVLGLEFVENTADGVTLRSGDTKINVYQSEGAGSGAHTLGCFVVDDIEKAAEDMRGVGITFEEYEIPGMTMENGIAQLGDYRGAWFKDPDGNIVAVVQKP